MLVTWLPLMGDIQNKGLSNTATTSTGSITYGQGKVGKCATFSSGAIILNPAPITTATPEFSFSFWYKTTSPSASQCIYNGRTSVGGPVSIFVLNGGFRFDDGAQHTLSYTIPTNTWEHYVITRDASNIKLYVNGVLKVTTTSTSFTCTATYASIGMSSANTASPSSNPLVGSLQDYRIYNHVLSVREIKELAKGLAIHLPLNWSGNPNMIKNSYTMLNKSTGNTNSNSCTVTKSIIEDDAAPCKYVLKVVATNATTASKANVGAYYTISNQGLTTSDLVSGNTYTYSFWAKADSANVSDITFAPGGVYESQTGVSYSGFTALTPGWRKHTATFKWTSTSKLTACFYVTIPANGTNTYYICGLKLEAGAVATPYVPNTAETAYTGNSYGTMCLSECSGYNKTVTVTGTPKIGNSSPRGTGTETTGGCKITVDGFPCGTETPFTIAYWHRPTSGTYVAWADSLGFGVGNSSSTTATTVFRRENISTAGTGYIWYGNGVVTTSGGICGYTATIGTWYHVALTFDGDTFIMYINGAKYNTSALASDYAGFKTYSNFYVGDTASICQTVADVRIYATCLSASDIKALYNTPVEIDKCGKLYCNNLVEV